MDEKEQIADLQRELDALKSALGVATVESPVGAATSAVPAARKALFGKGRLVLVVALLAVAGIVAGVLVSMRASGLPKDTAFRIFGHNVSVDELNNEVDTLTALYGVEVPTDEGKLAGFRKDVAKAYAVSLLLDKAAAQRNIVIADKAAKDVLTRYISQQFGDASDAYDKFTQALGSAGTSEAEVVTELKRQLALNKLYNDVTKSVTVSDAQVRSEFDTKKDSLATPETRELRNIVVATQEQAAQLRTRLAAGQSFAALAKQFSLDGSTKDKGGSLGNVGASSLDPAYAKAAFATASGQAFGPVQTQYGWNVGLVVSITPSTPAVFDQVKDDLKQQLLVKAQLDVWRTWLSGEIRHAKVRYAARYRPADPDSAPTTGPAATQPSATPSTK